MGWGIKFWYIIFALKTEGEFLYKIFYNDNKR
jgi:hypothetical protein